MAQVKTYNFTAGSSLANVDIDVGFDAAWVRVLNQSGAGDSGGTPTKKQAEWFDTMADAEAFLITNTGSAATDEMSFVSSNGISVINQGAIVGSDISAFTNANPGVITVADASGAGFAAGDTIVVTNLADDQSAATSLNGEYTIASISGNALTLDQDTSSYSVYVSGGTAYRKTDANGDAVVNENYGKRIVRIGTGCQTASDEYHVIIVGKEPVV